MNKLPESLGANHLVGNVLVGLGLAWLLQHFLPQTRRWAYPTGVLLGFVSGLWQIFKDEGMFPGPPSSKDRTPPRDDKR